METGRQSRLFIRLYKTNPLPPSTPQQIPSQDRKPGCNLQVRFPWPETKAGRAVQVRKRSVHLQHVTLTCHYCSQRAVRACQAKCCFMTPMSGWGVSTTPHATGGSDRQHHRKKKWGCETHSTFRPESVELCSSAFAQLRFYLVFLSPQLVAFVPVKLLWWRNLPRHRGQKYCYDDVIH